RVEHLGVKQLDICLAFAGAPELRAPARQLERAPLGDQVPKRLVHLRKRAARKQAEQQVVQLLGVARLGSSFTAHAIDGFWIECTQVPRIERQTALELHRARPSFLERRIVQKRVRPTVENLVREQRGLAGLRSEERRVGQGPRARWWEWRLAAR